MGDKIENFISNISPSWALKRATDSKKLAMVGGYSAGSTSSAIFQEFLTATTDADSSVIWDRERIIARDRDLVRNVPVASAIIKRTCDHAIGDRGLALHSQIDREYLGFSEDKAADWQKQAEYIWRLFSESEESDLERQNNLAEKTYLTLKSELEGGDCFTLFTNKSRPGSNFNLKLQTVEGEYVSTPNGIKQSKNIVEGVEKAPDGSPLNYHFSAFHPGDRSRVGNKWEARKIFDSRGRRNILHHYDKIRPGQTRGIPVLGPATGKLLQLGRASDAELMATVLNSYYAMVVQGPVADTVMTKKSPNETNTSISDDDNLTMGSGLIVRVQPGSKIEGFDPKRPNLNFWEYFKSIVSEIGACVGVPRSLILMEYDKSYSASRGEVLLAWVYFMAKRTHIAINFNQPVYEAVIDEAVSKGMISAPGYFNSIEIRRAYLGSPFAQWTGPTRPAIDELKEARALEVFHSMRAQSLKEIIAKTTGKDVVRVHDQLVREHKLRTEAGLEEPDSEIINGDENANT